MPTGRGDGGFLAGIAAQRYRRQDYYAQGLLHIDGYYYYYYLPTTTISTDITDWAFDLRVMLPPDDAAQRLATSMDSPPAASMGITPRVPSS